MTLPKLTPDESGEVRENIILLVDKKRASARKLTSLPPAAPEPTFVRRAREALEDEGPSSTPAKWDQFEKLGLAPQRSGGLAAKLIVSLYRLLGFAILTVIVAVLLGYIAMTVFYYFDNSWATPVAISPTDEKVVELRSQLAAQENARDKLAADLEDTDRAIAAQQDFQLEFAKAIRGDLAGRRVALGRVRELAEQAQATRTQIRTTNDQFAALHATQLADEYSAGLIDRSSMLAGKYQLGQIATSSLSLGERQAEYEQRATQLADETRALDALLSGKHRGVLSYDALKIKRDYDTSKLDLQRATANRTLLQKSLQRQDEILQSLKDSAFLRVITDHAVVAQVPYDHLEGVDKDTPIYACRIEMVWCREVGRVIAILPGEVTFRHPHRDIVLRGQLVELALDDAEAAAKNVLFLGKKPIGF